MISHKKLGILILMTIGCLFVLSTMIKYNLVFNSVKSNRYLGYSNNIKFDKNVLKISTISGKIHINNNWSAAKSAGICMGSGSYSDPYVIENIIIDGKGVGSCILIENSDAFFKIENCTVYNSGSKWEDAGIGLYNVNNSQIINNICTSNFHGISLNHCNNNTILGNNATNSLENGIYLFYSDNTAVSGNIANNNWWWGRYGISLWFCRNITVSNNKMNDWGLDIYGYLSLNTIYADTTNLINGKPLYYYNNKIELGVDNFTNAGQVILHNCHDSSIRNLNTSYGSSGISLSSCSNINITGNTANYNKDDGISLSECDYINISENSLDYNNDCGISLYNSYTDIISKNNASYNFNGIELWICINNNISGNSFNNNRGHGIRLHKSDFNFISENTANKNIIYGIYLSESNNNNVSGNTLIGNQMCIYEDENSNSNVFKNNFCRNREIIIPGYNIFILFSSLSISIPIIIKKLKKF